MLRNFITSTDLKASHPTLGTQLWKGVTDYDVLISEGFDRVNDDLFTSNINPRLIMTPLDLKRPQSLSTSGHTLLITSTETVSTTATSISAAQPNYRRLVVDTKAITGSWTIQLQGSNDNVGWEDVTGGSITADSINEQNIVFNNEYAWYRYVNTNTTSGGSDSITYSIALVETIFDRLIIYKSLAIIFRDFRRTQGDQSDTLMKDYEKAYNNLISHLRYSYDANDSGQIDAGEEIQFKDAYFIR